MAIKETCHLWRNFDDIQDSWHSVLGIVDYYGNNQNTLIPLAGPGHWNDPDMVNIHFSFDSISQQFHCDTFFFLSHKLIIGNFGLSFEQSRAQMALWAIMASPLLTSVDLRTIRPEYKAILQNSEIIAVNQDPMGVQGRRIYQVNFCIDVELTWILTHSAYSIERGHRNLDQASVAEERKQIFVGYCRAQ